MKNILLVVSASCAVVCGSARGDINPSPGQDADPVKENILAKEMKSAFPKFRKTGAVSPYGEVSPFVFKGRLMRLELIDPSRGLAPTDGGICAGIRDVETGRIVSRFGEDCYYFAAFVDGDRVIATGTERQTGTAGDTVWAFESTDLVNWSRRVLVRKPGWTFCNTSIAKGDDGYVLCLEADAPKHAPCKYTVFFATSKDLKNWDMLDPRYAYPKFRYCGGPFLRFHKGWYYLFLVTELPCERFATYLFRTKDFRTWDTGLYNPFLTFSQEDRAVSPTAREISPAFAEEVKRRFICSASDLEMCEYRGRTCMNYIIGDQHGFYYLCEAWYDGPMGELLENFFR